MLWANSFLSLAAAAEAEPTEQEEGREGTSTKAITTARLGNMGLSSAQEERGRYFKAKARTAQTPLSTDGLQQEEAMALTLNMHLETVDREEAERIFKLREAQELPDRETTAAMVLMIHFTPEAAEEGQGRSDRMLNPATAATEVSV